MEGHYVFKCSQCQDNHDVLDAFHEYYYTQKGSVTNNEPKWFGARCMKLPMDLFVYQEIIVETRPDLIVELGTADGGSALFMAMVCAALHQGNVLAVDKTRYMWPSHPCLTFWETDVLDSKLIAQIEAVTQAKKKVMIILDDDHSCSHVLQELDAYSKFVTPGCYMVVEDTNVNGHPVFPNYGPGPWEALQQWLPDHPEFEVDSSREHFGLTFFPRGWLRRV